MKASLCSLNVLLVLFIAVLLVAPAAAPRESSAGITLNLSGNTGISYSPRIAISGSNVYAVWRGVVPQSQDIFLRRSVDGGASFYPTINVSDNPGTSQAFRIAASGSNVYVVWEDDTPGNEGVLLRRSSDSGTSFGETLNLSHSGESSDPELAASGSNVYVVWTDSLQSSSDVFLSRSVDGGNSFRSPVNLSLSGDSVVSQVAVSGSNIYVLWTERVSDGVQVVLKRSTDDGANFGEAMVLSKGPGNSEIPRMAVSGSEVYVVWQVRNPTPTDIFLRKSNDEGVNFGEIVNLSDSPRASFGPEIAISDSNVYVAWSENTPAGNHFFLRRSLDGESSFSAELDITEQRGSVEAPVMSVAGSNVYSAWAESLTDGIFMRGSIDGGASFGQTIDLGQNTVEGADLPQITASGSSVYAVWEDGKNVSYFLNRGPVISFIEDKEVDELTELRFSPGAVDPDGDPLFYSLGPGAPVGASVSQNGIFGWTPTEANSPGSFPVTIVVSDGLLNDFKTITITVREVNGGGASPLPTPWWLEYWYLILVGATVVATMAVLAAWKLRRVS